MTQSSVGATTDLIWHNPSTGQTVSWAMNGATTASSTVLLQLPNWKVSRTADLNGDGQQDLIWENSSTNQIVAWLMNGTQTLQSTVLLQNAGWKITHTGDFNGDGKADLLFYNATTGQTVLWLMNGTTVLSSQILFTSTVWQVSLVADLNGDGKADLIWRNSQTGQTAAWLMNGTAVSANATLLELASWRVTQVGDLDGDGRDDLIWTNAGTGQTVVWLMNGLATSSSTLLFTHPTWRVSRVADLDGDGKQDLIWGNSATGEVAGWLMDGAAIKSNAVLLGNANWQLANVVDLNGDGKQDLIWRNSGTNQTVAWVMNGLAAASQTTLLGIAGWEVVGTRSTSPPPAPAPVPTMVAPVIFSVRDYSCDSVKSDECDSSPFAIKWSLTVAQLVDYLSSSYGKAKTDYSSELSCKVSAACPAIWGAGLASNQVQAMQRAASAVVRVSSTNDHMNFGSFGIGISGSCSGVVVKSTLDSSIYVLTAGHCLYEQPLYPNVRFSTYRDLGLPLYVTFGYEAETCGAPITFTGPATLTLPAMLIGFSYSTAGQSHPDWNFSSPNSTDLAVLRLMAPLPANVMAATVRQTAVTQPDKLFSFWHPLGLDKMGGLIDNGADFGASTEYQYILNSSKRISERGSSGGPLFAYDASKNEVSVVGTLSGSEFKGGSLAKVCDTSQRLNYGRLDVHAPFLAKYLGKLN